LVSKKTHHPPPIPCPLSPVPRPLPKTSCWR
jgi:hypothetical protein